MLVAPILSEIFIVWEDLFEFGFSFNRLVKLLEEIMQEKENKTLIFTETKKKSDDLVKWLRRDG